MKANFNGGRRTNSFDLYALCPTAFSHFWLPTSYKQALQLTCVVTK